MRFWGSFGAAVTVGLLIAWVDARPTWDDTGITAAAIFLTAGFLGFAAPRWAWLWALSVGAWIPAYGLLRHGDYAVFLALIVAFCGAYLGTLARWATGLWHHLDA